MLTVMPRKHNRRYSFQFGYCFHADHILTKQVHAPQLVAVLTRMVQMTITAGQTYLALFIKGHDDNSSAMALDCGSMLSEGLFTFLHGDGVDDALALAALQACLHYKELGGVNHEGHLADLRV